MKKYQEGGKCLKLLLEDDWKINLVLNSWKTNFFYRSIDCPIIGAVSASLFKFTCQSLKLNPIPKYNPKVRVNSQLNL